METLMPEICIIIPTRNRADALLECLWSLAPQVPATVEWLISDDSDDDRTRRMVEKNFPAFRWLHGPRKGPGANRNAAVGSTTAQWLVFLDDDITARPGLWQAYAAAFAEPGAEDALLVGPTFRVDARKDSLLWEAPAYGDTKTVPPSCNFALSRALFLEFGGFDERFRVSYEDIEFFTRLLASGIRVRFLPGAAVEHPSRPLPSASGLAARWEARVIMAHDYGASAAQILWHLPRHVLMVILSRFRRRRPPGETLPAARIFLQEFLTTLRRLPGWIRQYSGLPRSPFWTVQAGRYKVPRRFGF